jgi:ABC-type Mn2+/Zn2+ transport system permease subunit
MSLLWGSIFAVDNWQSVVFMSISLALLAFHFIFYRQLKAVFFTLQLLIRRGLTQDSYTTPLCS